MHLRHADLDRYLGRDMDERTLTFLDAHHATCLPCTQLLAAHAAEHVAWERHGLLGRLVRVPMPAEPAPAPARADRGQAA